MKKSLITALAFIPLAAISSSAFASDPGSEQPLQLSATEMDGVTAGAKWRAPSIVFKTIRNYVSNSNVTVLQVGNGNYAFVFAGNLIIHL